MPKIRSNNQRYSKISENKLNEIFANWIVNKLGDDYGIDFDIRICGKISEKGQTVENASFYTQLKSTKAKCVSHPFEDLDIDDIELFVNQALPVLLIKYYENDNKFYWTIIQTYVWDVLDKEDPKWKKKGQKRIKLVYPFKNLDIIENAILDAQKRIWRYQVLSMGIGEGINFNDLELQRKRNLNEFKFASLKIAAEKIKKGEFEKGTEILEEVLLSPGDDQYKLNAIFNLILQYNVLIDDTHEKILDLAEKGIKLSNTIKAPNAFFLFNIFKLQVHHIEAITSLRTVLYARKYDSTYGEGIFSFFYQKDVQALNSGIQSIIKQINSCLIEMVNRGYQEELTLSLAKIIETITYQNMCLCLIDPNVVRLDEPKRAPLILALINLVDAYKDQEKTQIFYFQIGEYYYWSGNNEQAINFIEKAINIAKIEGFEGNLSFFKEYLEKIKDKPCPYDCDKETTSLATLSLEEYQTRARTHLEILGFDFKNPDEMTQEAIIPALNDINPSKILQYCENIRVSLVSTSPLGKSIALPTLGMKSMWCKYHKCVVGFNFEVIFNGFFKETCEKCERKKPRDTNWICTIPQIEELSKDAEFQKEIHKITSKL